MRSGAFPESSTRYASLLFPPDLTSSYFNLHTHITLVPDPLSTYTYHANQQTFAGAESDLPRDIQKMRKSWASMNPAYEIRTWSDQACLEFLESEFPEYLATYMQLPSRVEKADLFRCVSLLPFLLFYVTSLQSPLLSLYLSCVCCIYRYLVVYKQGGVYADVDTAPVVPIDEMISDQDAMVVGTSLRFYLPTYSRTPISLHQTHMILSSYDYAIGLEHDLETYATAYRLQYNRRRQLLQFIFAATPGHPALRYLLSPPPLIFFLRNRTLRRSCALLSYHFTK